MDCFKPFNSSNRFTMLVYMTTEKKECGYLKIHFLTK